MLGSAVGSGYVTLMNVLNVAPGSAGLIGFVCVQSGSMLHFLIGTVLALVSAFGLTYLFSKNKRFNPETAVEEPAAV